MLKQFLTKGLSAAGISHVVTARSFFRRIVWIIALVMISTAMMYMTYNVLQEYLKYPVVVHSKRSSLKEMEFPAVTVCGFNLIPRHNAKEANLQYIEEMEEILKTLPKYHIPDAIKIRCYKDPLCTWNRFLDKCFCKTTPCDTTECYRFQNISGVCGCSKALCLPAVSNYTQGCMLIEVRGTKQCFCKTDYEDDAPKNKTDLITPDFMNAVESLDLSLEIKTLLIRLKNSSNTSLRDVQRFIKPNITIRDNYGSAFENLIISCTFAAQPCDVSETFDTVYSPSYGKCYMFNYGGVQDAEGKVQIVKHPGKSHGLEMYLKYSRSNSIPLLYKQHGARIVVHDPRSLPFAAERGIDILPDDMASFMLQYRETNRLGPPWGDCAYDGDNETSSYLEIPYDKLGCERQCRNAFIFKRCKCYHTTLLTGSIAPKRNAICSENEAAADCYRKALYESKQENCRCPPPCKEKTYDVSISAGKINREYFRMLKMARSLKIINGTPAVSNPEFNQGLMGLRVYFRSFTATNITETSIYSWEFLVANIGGNLGLFLGLSLITFVEIGEFIMDFTVHIFSRNN